MREEEGREASLPPREAPLAAASLLEPDVATGSPGNRREMTSSESEPVVAAAPNTLEPHAHQLDDADESSARPDRSRGSLLAYVGVAVALVLMLGSIAVLTSSTESGDPALPASQSIDALETTQRARASDPKMPHGESPESRADTAEAAAPTPVAPHTPELDTRKPDTLDPARTSASAPAPEADANLDASAATESSAPASADGPVTVTIHASPPEAIIYDEKQRIGKGIARISMMPGRKRSMLALLNLHHPKHFVLDGSQTTVNVTLEPMDANAIARSIAAQTRKTTHSPTTAKRTAR